jgi:hypothetical protein
MSASDYLTVKKLRAIKTPSKYVTRDAGSLTELNKITTILNGTTKNDFGIEKNVNLFDVAFIPLTEKTECTSIWACDEPTPAPNKYPHKSQYVTPPLSIYPNKNIVLANPTKYPSIAKPVVNINGCNSLTFIRPNSYIATLGKNTLKYRLGSCPFLIGESAKNWTLTEHAGPNVNPPAGHPLTMQILSTHNV